MKVKILLTWFWVLSSAVAFTFFASPATAMPTGFNKMYVFGDSLSDNGNVFALSQSAGPSVPLVPPPPRYYSGRFSNGPVWTDVVADAMGITPGQFVPALSPQASVTNFQNGYSLNYAYGGSGTGLQNTTPDGLFQVRGLLGQVQDFTALVASAGGTFDPAHSLYTVWSGANDYLLAGPVTGIPSPPDPAASVGNTRTAIQELYDLGARNFLVPTLIDLGALPIVALSGPGAQAYFTSLSQQHNDLLIKALYDLIGIDPGITFYSPDIFSLYREVLVNPAAFGFTHPITELGLASRCLILDPHDCTVLPTALDGLGFPTWDEEHPTAAMHALIAQAALDANAIPEPATSTLFLVGFFSLTAFRNGVVFRRQK